MRPIRVAHLVWRLSPTGGIPRVVRDLSAALDPDRVETCVVSVRPESEEDRLSEVIAIERFRSADHRLGANRVRLALTLLRVTRQLRSLHPDVIHLHSGTSWLGLPAALLPSSTRTILEVHDEPQSGRSRPLNVALMRVSARYLGFRVLVHSTVVRDRTAEAFGLAPEDISLIPLGVDTEMFRRDERLRTRGRKRHDLRSGQAMVAWVGRVEPLKRPGDALTVARAVLAQRPETVFVLAGSGSEEQRLRAEAADEPRIHVAGRVDDLPELLNAADIFLSTSGYEGYGLGVAEAMACGLPVVSTRAGGVVDLVADGRTGHLAEVGDIDELAGHVGRLIDDQVRARSLGETAQEFARSALTRDAMAASYAEEYERLVSVPRRQRGRMGLNAER